MKKFKIVILILLISFLALNFYTIFKFSDSYTNSKIQLSSLKGSTSYLGRLALWQLLVQNNDWENASLLESTLNQQQIKDYKNSYQPQLLQDKLALLNNQEDKSSNDYLNLAKIQSILGQSSEAVNSIKKAHQVDPIREDVEKLFYQVN